MQDFDQINEKRIFKNTKISQKDSYSGSSDIPYHLSRIIANINDPVIIEESTPEARYLAIYDNLLCVDQYFEDYSKNIRWDFFEMKFGD